ncbi:hypothetical protein [Endothiovibrio diazotrophicus]
MRWWLLLPGVLVSVVVHGADDGLGRLFTTPAERAERGGAMHGPRLEGLARRAGGAVALWIDGRRVAVGDGLPAGGRVVAVEGRRVVVERAGVRRALRVGERLEGAAEGVSGGKADGGGGG